MIQLRTLLTENDWVGSTWKSCKHWNQTGLSYWDGQVDSKTKRRRPEIKIDKSAAEFSLSYLGPASGWAISHADRGSGDTLHQIFNVLMCECNPWLKDRPLRPDIENIAIRSRIRDAMYDVTITIPMIAEPEASKRWQIDRRGSMGGGDPGEQIILKSTSRKPNLQGPVRIQVSPGNIVEYMVCYTLPAPPKDPTAFPGPDMSNMQDFEDFPSNGPSEHAIKLKPIVTEITLGGVTPYATQFTWTRADEGHRETTFQADGIRITLAMVDQGRQQWAFAILTPTADGEGHTVAHSRSAAPGRVNYLRLMATVLEAFLDFATQWQPASIDITGSDTSSGAKEQQKTRIYRALLASNMGRITTAGYRVLDRPSGLWLVRSNVAMAKEQS